MKSLGRTRVNAASCAPMPLALDAAMRAFVMPLECRIGTDESDSAPPAMPTSMWPSRMAEATSAIAWFEDAQARLIV